MADCEFPGPDSSRRNFGKSELANSKLCVTKQEDKNLVGVQTKGSNQVVKTTTSDGAGARLRGLE